MAVATDDAQIDAYYGDEDVNAEEIDLRFLDEDADTSTDTETSAPKK